jgi:hypothetical protein
MAFITDLPTEILRLIFIAVADINLVDLFASRRTCKAFQIVITDILTKSPSILGLPIHAFLTSHFRPILDSASVGPEYAPAETNHPYAPFTAMPWASDPSIRSKWIREEASWWCIPLASPSGHLVQWLQSVEADQDHFPGEITHVTGGHVAFFFAAQGDEYIQRIHFPHGIPLGLVYDMIIAHSGNHCDWKLLFETRVGDPDAFHKFCQATWIGEAPDNLSEEDVKRFFTYDKDVAVMLVGTSGWWDAYNGKRRELWEPHVIGDDTHFEVEFPLPPHIKYVACSEETRLCFNYPE